MIDADRWWGMWAQSGDGPDDSGHGPGHRPRQGSRDGGRGRGGRHHGGRGHGGHEHGGHGHGGHGGHGHGGREQRGFGGDGPGRRGGEGGRVFGPGDLRIALLALIAEQPRHGYELIKEIEQRFGGTYAPSPGSVYPTLTLLEELGYIGASEPDRGKRLFTVAEAGLAFLAENKAAVDGVMSRMELAARAMSGRSAPEAIHEAMHTLKAALRFHTGAWSDAETDRVSGILERAAREIGRDDPTGSPPA